MGTELENYNEYEKALARLIEYVEAFERVWKFAPNRELENLFAANSTEEQEAIVEQLVSDADWMDAADKASEVDWG